MKLHSKKDSNYLYKYLFVALIPLSLFGILKNGFLLYKETTSTYILLKPTIYLAINLLLGLLIDFICNKKIKPNKYTVSLLILFLISSINTPIWLFAIGDLLLILLIKFDHNIFNKIALTKLIIIGIMYVLNTLSFTNVMESSGNYIFSFMDLIIKGQIGGIGTSNLILVIVLLLSLISNVFYKRNISLICILTYSFYFIL